MVSFPTLSALPTWITNPPSNDSEFFGIGEGTSREKARDVALKNILGQINTKVSASSVQKQSVRNNKFSENFEQVVNSSVEELPISGYKELNSHKHNNTFYTLISVSKNKLVSTFTVEIDENINRSKRIVDKQNQAGSELEWWFKYREELFKLLLVSDRINNLFPLLGSSVNRDSDVKSMANKLKHYASDYCLYVAPYHDKAVRSALRNKVVNAGLVADNKSCNYRLEMSETSKYRLMFGTTHTYSLYGTLSLIKHGNILTSESINEVGSSPSGESVAKQAAFYRLVQKIKNDNNQILNSLLDN